jgi:hypothetical protein
MAASVLNTANAVEVSVYVVRAFVRLREIVSKNKNLKERILALEAKLSSHDDKINSILLALRQLMRIESKPRRRIGFQRIPTGELKRPADAAGPQYMFNWKSYSASFRLLDTETTPIIPRTSDSMSFLSISLSTAPSRLT